MNVDKLHSIATNYIYIVPISIILMMAFLYWQKISDAQNDDNVPNSTFIIRNSLFVGLLVFFVVYYNKPLPSFEESMFVSPADF